MSWYEVEGVQCQIAFDYTCVKGNLIESLTGDSQGVNVTGDVSVSTTHLATLSPTTKHTSEVYKVNTINFRGPAIFNTPVSVGNEFTCIYVSGDTSSRVDLLSSNAVTNFLYLTGRHFIVNGLQIEINKRLGINLIGITYKNDTKKRNLYINNVFWTNTSPYNPIRTGELLTHIDTIDQDKNIIAYSVYSKELSQEQIETIFKNIEKELFELKSKTTRVKTSLVGTFNNIFKSSTKIKTKNQKDFWFPFKINNIVIKHPIVIGLQDVQSLKNIKDIVTEEDEPIVTDLFLLDRKTGVLVAKTRSNKDGEFEFKSVSTNLDYIVVSPHPRYEFRSIAKDYSKKG